MKAIVKTPISEIYSSIQGEGLYTGEKQLFVRLAGCPLRCTYCDTPGSLTGRGHPLLSVHDVLEKIHQINPHRDVKTVSVTGGEPLAHIQFLKSLIPELKKRKYRVYLETAGIHAEQLKMIRESCDVIAMDIKLPSAVNKALWEKHEKFLKMARGRVFVKVVVDKYSKENEIHAVVRLLKKTRPRPWLILQPVTAIPGQCEPVSPEVLARFFEKASKELRNVLVMPQQHKLWGAR